MEICQRTLLEFASRGVSRLASAKVRTFLITKKPFPYFSYKKVDFYQKTAGYTIYNIYIGAMIISPIYAMRRIWRVYAKRPYFGHDCGGLVKFVGRKQYYVGIRHLY